MSTNQKPTVSSEQIGASATLMKEVVQAFEGVVPLTAIERQRLAKLKRGAHQVIPTIAHLATKFGIEAPGLPVADMMPSIERAREIQSLLSAVTAFQQTLKDEYLAASGTAWQTARVTYGMLQSAGRGNRRVADELEPVRKWFRHRVRNGNVVLDANGQPVPKRTSTAKASVAPVVAPVPSGGGELLRSRG